jgi:hypothetical protein
MWVTESTEVADVAEAADAPFFYTHLYSGSQKTGDGRPGGYGRPLVNPRKLGGQGHRIGSTNSAHDRPTDRPSSNDLIQSAFTTQAQ